MPNFLKLRSAFSWRLIFDAPVLAALGFLLAFDSGLLVTVPGVEKSLWPLPTRLATGFVYLLCLFYLLRPSRWLFAFGVPVLFAVTTVAAYFMSRFGIDVNVHVIAALMASNTGEASEFLSWELFAWLVPALIASAGLVFLRWRGGIWRPRHPLTWAALILLGMAAMVLARLYYLPANHFLATFDAGIETIPADRPQALELAQAVWPGQPPPEPKITRGRKGRVRFDFSNPATGDRLRLYAGKGDFTIKGRYFERRYDRQGRHLKTRLRDTTGWRGLRPRDFLLFHMAEALADYGVRRAALARAAASLKDISLPPSKLDPGRGDDLTVVLVIGESARADHFGVNGYGRDTTPRLSQTPNLVSFSQIRSCAASSTVAVPCVLTRLTTEDLPGDYRQSDDKAYFYQPVATENAFISLFRKHGFATAWLSLNRILGRKNEPISVMIAEAETRYFGADAGLSYSKARDEHLLPPLRRFLAEHSGRALAVVHTRGSHWRYDARYPREARHFTPTCRRGMPADCPRQHLINAYDNTIRYTDAFLAAIIGLLQDRKALLAYTSDHGESLGEAGYFTHSVMNRPEQRQVPLIWWASDSYLAESRRAFANLAARKDEPANHDHLFHSLLDCAGISSSVIDKGLSLCADR